ncbi:DUF937 domain-containing protein [Methylobacterium durans]|uniref:DUF937 domain-containing protein n=1 Tax=Methylobacterium durans TaxID=2202825 RepID=UPI002AFEFD5A|nr:DUF937 domain-containing protein [Methylobacterium durans]MEA1831637.1 DUF937 domain-containing protein [Methylobacterium durans]
MFNPIDMLQGQSAGMQGLAQQFGLTTDQTRRAMEALLPAFTIGLQRNAPSDPIGFGQLFGLPGASAGNPTAQTPEVMLGQLFGSPMLAQAVVQQAAAASGVGSQVVRQMLPLMAGMVVASIVHMILNQSPAPQQPAPKPAPANPYVAANTFWADMLRAFAPPQPPQAAPVAPPPPSPPPVEAARSSPKDPSRDPAKSLDKSADKGATEQSLDMFNKMLQTGAEVQTQNVKAMQDIFDAFWADPKEKAGSKETEQDKVPPVRAASRAAPRSAAAKSATPASRAPKSTSPKPEASRGSSPKPARKPTVSKPR